MLGQALPGIRPELDLYLMTEISLEDVAGRMGHKQYSQRLDTGFNTPPAANRSDPQEPGISRVLLPCRIFSQSLGRRRPCLVEKQGGDLGFEESTMPTQGADAPQAPLVRPPGDGPGVHPEHQRNLPRCQ